MKQQGSQCEDCGMFFDSQESLMRHKNKFCVNSKYGNMEILNSQFQKISQGKNISLLGKNVKRSQFEPGASSLKQSKMKLYTDGPQGDIDRQYRMLIRQIGDKEDLKNKLERQKHKAEEQLMNLEQKQKEIVVEAKRKDLNDVIKKREELSKQEETLEKEIKLFERDRKEQQKKLATEPNQDFVYREGREAGKLAMQRRILQEKKRELENNLKAKKRQQQKVQRQLGNLNEIPIYIPDYKIKEPTSPTPKQTYDQLPQNIQNRTAQPIRESNQANKTVTRPNRNDKLGILQPESIIKPPENAYAMSSKRSNVSNISNNMPQQDQSFLRASRFAGNEKTLFESLNPKGKSDEDIFIESLVAQQYDALNLLSKIPKDSQLYRIKLKQFQQMSKVRQQLKDKVQLVRLQKVKRQFELEKQMTQTQKNNLLWLDNNRKNMLSKGANIIHNKVTNDKNKINNNNSGEIYNDPGFLNPSFKNIPNQFFNNNNTNNYNGNGLTNLYKIQSNQRNSIQMGRKGYRVTVKYVKNYENNAPLSVKLIILEDGSTNPKSIFATKYHDNLAPKDDRNPYNPGMKNRKDQSGNIAFNETFQVGEDLQSLFNNNQNDIYLWIMLMEKDQEKISNEPTIYAWYCFKLTHFGQIRQGVFTLNLYHDNFPFPVPTDMNRIKGRAEEEIVIELSDIILAEHKPMQKPLPQEPALKTNMSKRTQQNSMPTSQQNRNPTTGASRRKHTMKIKTSKQTTMKNIDERFFHQNEKQQNFTAIKSGKCSFNIILVGMRTLPSYIGPLKLQLSLIDSTGQVALKQQALSEFEGDMYNPNINFFRKIVNQQLSPSTILLIRIIALNVFNYQPGLLGFAYFHLFYNQQGEEIEKQGEKNFFLINGEFQLPIFWGNNEKYINKPQSQSPKIPCTSLLISINAPTQKIQFPQYSSGRYNTSFFDISQIQYRLFQQQDKRQVLDNMQYIKAYLKFKGVNNNDQEKIQKFLSQSLAFKTENINNMQNLRNMAEYNPSFGIIFAVDMLKVPTSKNNYYYFCSICLSPPAEYYKKGDNDLVFLYKIDLASSNTSQLMLSDDLLSFSPAYNQSTSIIIELLRVQIGQNGSPSSNIETCSHSIFPLFDLDSQIVCGNVGQFEVRMEKGEFDTRDIKGIQNGLKNYLEEIKGKQKSQYSAQFRIMNGYFSNQFSIPKISGKGKSLRSIFQNSKGFKNTQDSIKKIIESTYGVKLE